MHSRRSILLFAGMAAAVVAPRSSLAAISNVTRNSDYWTSDRVRGAQAKKMVIDVATGQGYQVPPKTIAIFSPKNSAGKKTSVKSTKSSSEESGSGGPGSISKYPTSSPAPTSAPLTISPPAHNGLTTVPPDLRPPAREPTATNPNRHDTPTAARNLRQNQQQQRQLWHFIGMGNDDNTGSSSLAVDLVLPADGSTVTTKQVDFVVRVTGNTSQIAGVTLYVWLASDDPSNAQQFTCSSAGSGKFTATLAFPEGNDPYDWYVIAEDATDQQSTSGTQSFATSTSSWTTGNGSGSGGSVTDDTTASTDDATAGYATDDATTSSSGNNQGNVVTDGNWTMASVIKNATGRLLFTQGSVDYVCSGTVVQEDVSGRSIVITAGHCLYSSDDQVFSQNMIFVPDQTDTAGMHSDSVCVDDPMGCWDVAIIVIDQMYVETPFPGNSVHDYGFAIVHDSGAHRAGFNPAPDALDDAVGGGIPLVTTQSDVTVGAYTYNFGYPWSEDPHLCYCAQDLSVTDNQGSSNEFWWLASCAMTEGSSGGPYLQGFDGSATSTGHIVSVISWSYTDSKSGADLPGEAGPFLFDNSAGCMFTYAQNVNLTDNYGAIQIYYDSSSDTCTLATQDHYGGAGSNHDFGNSVRGWVGKAVRVITSSSTTARPNLWGWASALAVTHAFMYAISL